MPATRSIDLGGGVTMEFVLVKPGSFSMGSETGADEEKPVHRVALTKPFYLGKFEVTQKQWRQAMGRNPSKFKGEQNPVGGVSWYNAQEFMEKLNALTGGRGFRLPTEAEWEYACRAGSTGDYAGTGKLDDMGWYDGNSEDKTHAVGTKQPNAWGLYDMHGNVFEWCSDWNGAYAAGAATDPAGPETGTYRLLRGGSEFDHPTGCRAATRALGFSPDARFSNFGVRVALGLE